MALKRGEVVDAESGDMEKYDSAKQAQTIRAPGPDPFASAQLLKEIWDSAPAAAKAELATRLLAKLYERVDISKELVNDFIDAKLREVMLTAQLTADLREDLEDKLRRALRGSIEAEVQRLASATVQSAAGEIGRKINAALRGY